MSRLPNRLPCNRFLLPQTMFLIFSPAFPSRVPSVGSPYPPQASQIRHQRTSRTAIR